MYLFDPTGKVNQPQSRVLAEDTFDKSMSGFTQLFTPDSDRATAPDLGRRYVSPLCRIKRSGLPRIALKTPGVADTTAIPVQAMGIKRMMNVYGNGGRYLLEALISVETEVSQTDRPAAWGWGLDTAKNDGTRRFFKVRYLNYDGSSQVRKWQIKTGLGSSNANYVDIPNATGVNLDVLTNENKALQFYIALEVDFGNGKFLGFRVGDYFKLGSLASTPDTSISDIGAVASEALTTFAGGINTCFDIEPRTDAARTQAQSNLHWHRLTYLGA